MIVGALLLPLLPRRAAAVGSLAIASLSLATFWFVSEGPRGNLEIFGTELTVIRIDSLSRIFGLVFHIAAILSAIGEKDPRLAWLGREAKRWDRADEKTLVFVSRRESLTFLKKELEYHTSRRVAVFHEDLLDSIDAASALEQSLKNETDKDAWMENLELLDMTCVECHSDHRN